MTAFEQVLMPVAGVDVLIVDMAPIAVALRCFSLPFTKLAWVAHLRKLRELICRIRVARIVVDKAATTGAPLNGSGGTP